ncbi:hypothetical protein SKAU_G00050860 [Synaphobranchus kaupii]|uniref:Peptidase S1 domain-containing protein n=1 Tax=Synaphobranchus kaupii TaxID=118154 RepID=A0A9Q1J8M2_SYNKA|nr:hypothetical protein SKAU_G00050860 [Synaphobranchus kaupii]
MGHALLTSFVSHHRLLACVFQHRLQYGFDGLPDAMSASLLTPLVVGLLIALAEAAQQNSGIVNGKEAKPHSRPYMVSVQQWNKHECGGFLVSKSFVMTAAHCLTRGQTLTVLLGAHDISGNEKSNRAEVKSYHIYPGFDADSLVNDIMLLELKSAVPETKEVQWIPLPDRDQDVKPQTLCSVAGWGYSETNGPQSPRLLEVNVTVVDRTVCEKAWKIYAWKTITPSMMCAGGSVSNKGFCRGDSGGPLVCSGLAVGIVSFNYKHNCTYPNMPNVYTQISTFLPWIKTYIKHMS